MGISSCFGAGPAWPKVAPGKGGFEKLTGPLRVFGFVEIFCWLFSDYFGKILVFSPVVEAWFGPCLWPRRFLALLLVFSGCG